MEKQQIYVSVPKGQFWEKCEQVKEKLYHRTVLLSPSLVEDLRLIANFAEELNKEGYYFSWNGECKRIIMLLAEMVKGEKVFRAVFLTGAEAEDLNQRNEKTILFGLE